MAALRSGGHGNAGARDDSAGRDDTAAAPPGKSALRLWLRLLSCVTAVEKELGARLRRRFDMSLSRFDVLAQLDRAPQGMTMSQLSSQVMVTNGNITSLVKGLEAAALVAREADPRDRRIAVVSLTDEGRARFRAMAREHERWVAEILGEASAEQGPDMTVAEQDALLRLLDRVKQSARRASARRATANRETSP